MCTNHKSLAFRPTDLETQSVELTVSVHVRRQAKTEVGHIAVDVCCCSVHQPNTPGSTRICSCTFTNAFHWGRGLLACVTVLLPATWGATHRLRVISLHLFRVDTILQGDNNHG